jgi:hypothetical protein
VDAPVLPRLRPERIAHDALEAQIPRVGFPVRARALQPRRGERHLGRDRLVDRRVRARRQLGELAVQLLVRPWLAGAAVKHLEQVHDAVELVGVRGLHLERGRQARRRHERAHHAARLAVGRVERREGALGLGALLAARGHRARDLLVRAAEAFRGFLEHLGMDADHAPLHPRRGRDLGAAGEHAVEPLVIDRSHEAPPARTTRDIPASWQGNAPRAGCLPGRKTSAVPRPGSAGERMGGAPAEIWGVSSEI